MTLTLPRPVLAAVFLSGGMVLAACSSHSYANASNSGRYGGDASAHYGGHVGHAGAAYSGAAFNNCAGQGGGQAVHQSRYGDCGHVQGGYGQGYGLKGYGYGAPSAAFMQQYYQVPQPQVVSAPALPTATICPSGTTMGANGTCVMSSTTSYTTSSYTPSTSYDSYSSSSMMDCPAGTTMQSDGTCLQGSSSYTSSTSYSGSTYSSYDGASSSYTPSTSYSSGSSYSGSSMLDCPAGTTMQSDGTCMTTGSSYSSATSYTSPGSSYDSLYTSDSYLPYRK